MVKLSYSFVVFISFALQFYVPITFLWPWILENWLQRYEGTKSLVYFELIFRYLLVWILCAISVCVPHLGTEVEFKIFSYLLAIAAEKIFKKF